MWPAVPSIIATPRSPALLFPHLERAQRTSVRKMLVEELAQETLVRARGAVGERHTRIRREKAPEGVARVGWKHASGGRESPAPLAERTARGVAEHHGRI